MSNGSAKFTKLLFVRCLSTLEGVICVYLSELYSKILQKKWVSFESCLLIGNSIYAIILEDGNKSVLRFYLKIQSKFCAIVVGYERGYQEALWEQGNFL